MKLIHGRKWNLKSIQRITKLIILLFVFSLFRGNALNVSGVAVSQLAPSNTIRFSTIPDWTSQDAEDAGADGGVMNIVWGDVDNDGDLDLVASAGYYLKIYYTEEGELQTRPGWRTPYGSNAYSLALGDIDNDGDLDLVAGSTDGPNEIYYNDDGEFPLSPTQFSEDENDTRSIALGDFDGDGDLDLAVGNEPTYSFDCRCGLDDGGNKIYLNVDGVLQSTPVWTSEASDDTRSVAWGDVDGDGDLDLAVGNDDSPDKIYLNHNGNLDTTHAWRSTATDDTQSVAWGDVDGDGDLDLASAGWDESHLYLNDGSMLEKDPVWTSLGDYSTADIAWGDLDNDGDLDLAAGSQSDMGQYVGNKIYLNVDGILHDDMDWVSEDISWAESIALADYDGDGDLDLAAAGLRGIVIYQNQRTIMHTNKIWASEYDGDFALSLAWGDVDNDGDLDLAVSTSGPDMLYLNEDGVLQTTPSWTSDKSERSEEIAWGDIDNDGDLDLAVAGVGAPNKIYLNNHGILERLPGWESIYQHRRTTTIAWGDVDGDGDLDLAFGGSPSGIYINQDGTLENEPVVLDQFSIADDMAWGDLDNDGDLDLAIAAYGGGRVYHNEDGVLKKAIWSSTIEEHTQSVAWGDVDGDGDLDLALGNWGTNTLYLNTEGQLSKDPVWFSFDSDQTQHLVWGDADGDGDLDLAAGNAESGSGSTNILYLNEGGNLQVEPRLIGDNLCESAWDCFNYTESLAWGDVDNDGDIDLAIGEHDSIQVLYNQQNSQSDYYDNKLTIVIDRYTSSTVLDTDTSKTILAAANHYAIPQIRSGIIPIHYWLFQQNSGQTREVRAYYSVNGGGDWQEAIPRADTILTELTTAPYPTRSDLNRHTFYWDVNASGFFGQSDNVVVRLVALPNLKTVPNDVAGSYQYPAGASQTYPFRVRGTQIRVVDEEKQPVENAVVSRLQADSSAPSQLISGLTGPMQTTSIGYLQGHDELYTGDQLLAMAPIKSTEKYIIYHTSAPPTATGLNAHTVDAGGVQTLTVSSQNPLILFDLTVSLEWNASNDPVFLEQLEQNILHTSRTLYDWTDGQIALGNITIYQDREHWTDADIRIFASNQLRPTASQGGIVTSTRILTDVRLSEPITVVPGKVHIGAVWSRYGNPHNLGDDWSNVLAHELGHYLLFLEDTYLKIDPDTGRLVNHTDCHGTAMSDPYDALHSELRFGDEDWDDECGPSLAELPEWELMKLAYPVLQLPQKVNPGPSYMPFAFTQVQIEAPQTTDKPLRIDPNIALGETADELDNGQSYHILHSAEGMNEQIIDLGRPIEQSLTARGAREGDEICIFGRAHYVCTQLHNQSQPDMILKPLWEPNIILSPVNTNTLTIKIAGTVDTWYTATFYPEGANPQIEKFQAGVEHRVTLQNSAVDILVDVVGANEGERMITGYAIGSGPARLHSFDGPARLHSFDGPVSSGDGSVVIYPPYDLPEEAFIALQSATSPPNLPPGLSPLGGAYHLRPSVELADWQSGSITFQYLGIELALSGVPEENLGVYYIDDSGPVLLPATLYPEHNFVSAPLAGPGLYVLATGYRQPLYGPAWNIISHPASLAPQPVTEALKSIDEDYTIVYGCEPDDRNNPWRVYAPDAPAWVNDLTELEPQKIYQIYITENITWTVGRSSKSATMVRPCPLNPPATFYGTLSDDIPRSPSEAGMQIQAFINGIQCGSTQTFESEGQIRYVLHVSAQDVDNHSQCGKNGDVITFEINDEFMLQDATWDNRDVQNMDNSTPCSRTQIPERPTNHIDTDLSPQCERTKHIEIPLGKGRTEYMFYLPIIQR